MSCKAQRRKEPQTVSELEDSDNGGVSPYLSTFEDLAIKDYDPHDYNPYAGIHALTPEYMSPHQVINEPVGLMDTEREESEVINNMWRDMTKGSIRRKTSNEVIDEIYENHQEFMCKQGHTLISPGASRAITPDPSGHITNEDVPHDWGSGDDEKYASILSSYMHFAYSMTASCHPLRSLKGGGFNVVSGEVDKLYNVSFGTLDIQKCKHNFIFNQCAKCHDKISTMWLLDSGFGSFF